MRTVANQHQISVICRRNFDTANNFAKEGIADIRDNHQNGAGFITLDVAPHRLR
ncbi:Uncharacterised protein [Shigella sonnei]|nr:Uncharacterised protein [Shigella sonnei]CSG31113.1 Uncharacterised protein [Shigella sonnei]